jgi:hypothetical protein
MVRPMRTAVVTVALLGLGIASGATEAADRRCLSKTEARALYRTSYLYWRGQGGKRCWSSRRGGRAEPHQPSRQAVVALQQPPPLLILPAGLMPPHVAPQQFSVLDNPLFAWARAMPVDAEIEPGPVFTTFQGEQPDVWPILSQPEPANTAGIAIVVATGLLATAFGLGLWRWQLNRVRLT